MNVKYDIMGKRKIWFAFSLFLFIPGLISLFTQGLNLGIDFKGGNLMEVTFPQSVTVESIRQTLEPFGMGNAGIQSSNGTDYILRTINMDPKTRADLKTALDNKFGKVDIKRDEGVSAVVSGELTQKALIALGIASLGILAYITFRFEFFFAIAAIIAVLHDALITIGIFSIFQIEVDSSFVAAILTIIGYSIHDTIIIFDRIRENLRNRKKEDLATIANTSIWQTMTRSINTVLTVIFALVALLFFGGETTKGFSLAILIGVMLGAYSSIMNASPIWLEFKLWSERRYKQRRAQGKTA